MTEVREEKNSGGFMMKLAAVIVDKRNLVFLLVIIGVIFSMFAQSWVEVETDLTTYLPDDSESRAGLAVMEDQFVTYGTAQVMVANITLEDAWDVCEVIKEVDGVQSVVFDDSEDCYTNASALYTVTFDYDQTDDKCVEALEAVEAALEGQDVYISTALGNAIQENIESEVQVIMVLAAVVVIAVLLLTSKTYAEIPVMGLTFLIAMILNQGTNFLLGEISFVSNSVTSVLQLALSLDYAVILCNRFKEERERLPLREAVITALSKGIPEIGASSLTTIGGLMAMMFMQFKIGPDMAICLIKSILFALLSVFVIMPGLLMLFGPLMEKTAHRSFIPRIPFVGRFAYATRFIVPPLFLVVVLLGSWVSADCPYVYGYADMATPKLNETQIAENMIEENFGKTNFVALVVPKGDYATEKALLAELDEFEEVDYSMGLSNVEAMDGYMLSDKLTPRQFAELADLDYEVAQLVYTGYAAQNEEYSEIIGSISTYGVPLIDMFLFVCDQIDSGLVTLEQEQLDALKEAQTKMVSAQKQLQGTEYNRALIYLNLPEGGDETYAFLDTIRETARKYYPEGDIYVVGDSSAEQDFKETFDTDNTVITIVSILIVLVVLLFTFKSAGMPVLLILVIQGAIWINFSIPAITGSELFFMSYLVVSAIQMGANIDYAIVIASRYMEIKDSMPRKEAIIETMNFAFHTIVTSGSILVVAAGLIGNMTSEASIVGVGQSLCRGTIISIILVMFVLPQILLVGSTLVEKTSFSMPSGVRKKTVSGHVKVDGMVRGEIHGHVSGLVRADISGEVDLHLLSGSAEEEGVTADEA